MFLRRCKRRQEENKKQKRRFWVRKIFIEERKERDEWGNLFRKQKDDDREYCYMYLHMSPDRFEHLFNLVGPVILKQDTNYRKSISAKKRLVTTLRSKAVHNKH